MRKDEATKCVEKKHVQVSVPVKVGIVAVTSGMGGAAWPSVDC